MLRLNLPDPSSPRKVSRRIHQIGGWVGPSPLALVWENFLLLPRIRPSYASRPTRSLVTKATELYRQLIGLNSSTILRMFSILLTIRIGIVIQ